MSEISEARKNVFIEETDKFYRNFYPLQEKIYEIRGNATISADEKEALIEKAISTLLGYYPVLFYCYKDSELTQKETWIIGKVEEFNNLKRDFGLTPVQPIEVDANDDIYECESQIIGWVYPYVFGNIFEDVPKSECLSRILGYGARKLALLKQEEAAKQAETGPQKGEDCAEQFETRSEEQFWNPNSKLNYSQIKDVSDKYWLKFPQLEEQIYQTKDVTKINEALDLMAQYYPLLPFFFKGGDLVTKRSQIIKKMMEFASVRAGLTNKEDISKKVSYDATPKAPEEYEKDINDAMNAYCDLTPEQATQKDAMLVNIFNAYTNKPKAEYTGYTAPAAPGNLDVFETHFEDQFLPNQSSETIERQPQM